ncbi:MAG: hypothetical protein JXB30_04760 [Anaerolineae bacterium]|nr:hypothetical protein [Anaerolineae bacterium]
MALAEPEGYARMYLNEGEPMTVLLREAASKGVAPDYANRLLGVYEGMGVREYGSTEEMAPTHPHSHTPTPPHPTTPSLADPLTPRERDVLHLISLGLSNQQIAEELVIALNTVKRHTGSIYSKLDVKSRTQAIIRARELGLISYRPSR